MGKELNEVNNGLVREVDNENRDGRRDSKSPNPSDTATERNGSGGDRTSRSSDTGEKTVTVQEVDGLSLLNEAERKAYQTADEKEQKRLLRNAKKRERYAQNKKANGETVKPRKVNKSKTNANTTVIDNTQLNLIFMALSSAVASRPNCEHWLLSEAEINSITEPLSKMLAESETFSNMGQYSNQIALVMACLTVLGPRVFVTVQKSKEVKKIERTGQHTDTTVRDRKIGAVGKTKDSNNSDHRTDVIRNKKPDDKHNDNDVSFLGLALA